VCGECADVRISDVQMMKMDRYADFRYADDENHFIGFLEKCPNDQMT